MSTDNASQTQQNVTVFIVAGADGEGRLHELAKFFTVADAQKQKAAGNYTAPGCFYRDVAVYERVEPLAQQHPSVRPLFEEGHEHQIARATPTGSEFIAPKETP